ncbi:MAG: hypothetical protein LUG50_06820 [Planctomycetaceae bacterium]|nr:hypothetical protein [Planctomycetaceae bacterium]
MCGSVGFQGVGGYQMLSAFTNSIAQQQQAQAQAAAQQAQIEIGKRQADDLYKRRVAEAIYEMQEADLAQRQANDAATQSKSEIAREMLRAKEEAKAAASAAGVTGNSLNRMLTDISFTEQQKMAVVDTNRDNIVSTQQLQKHKAIQSTKASPFYYTEPSSGGGIFNSMFSVIPSLFSGLSFNTSYCSTPKTKSKCS